MPLIARALTGTPGLSGLTFAAALLLAGCGGGGDSSTSQPVVAPVTPPPVTTPPVTTPPVTTPPVTTPPVTTPPVTTPPATSAPVVSQFVARAQQASCADLSNKIYVIDQQYALMARTGKCADASYAYELFGATPDAPLCTKADSIAGPRTTCSDDKLKPLFETIVGNLDKANLGLGADHKVEPIAFLPKEGAAVPFDSVLIDRHSGIRSARKVLVKDSASFSALWAEHIVERSAPQPLPQVDFKTKMVIAVFAGNRPACYDFGIRRVTAASGKIVVQVADIENDPLALCPAVVSSPMQLVVVERSDAPVEFAAFVPQRVVVTPVEGGGRTELTEAANRVIKDSASWVSLWATHRPGTTAPVIDFSKRMVIAVFLGARPNGCNGVGIEGVYRAAGKLSVNVVEYGAGPGILCTQAIVFPYAMVTVDRSDEPVEFWTQSRQDR